MKKIILFLYLISFCVFQHTQPMDYYCHVTIDNDSPFFTQEAKKIHNEIHKCCINKNVKKLMKILYGNTFNSLKLPTQVCIVTALVVSSKFQKKQEKKYMNAKLLRTDRVIDNLLVTSHLHEVAKLKAQSLALIDAIESQASKNLAKSLKKEIYPIPTASMNLK